MLTLSTILLCASVAPFGGQDPAAQTEAPPSLVGLRAAADEKLGPFVAGRSGDWDVIQYANHVPGIDVAALASLMPTASSLQGFIPHAAVRNGPTGHIAVTPDSAYAVRSFGQTGSPRSVLVVMVSVLADEKSAEKAFMAYFDNSKKPPLQRGQGNPAQRNVMLNSGLPNGVMIGNEYWLAQNSTEPATLEFRHGRVVVNVMDLQRGEETLSFVADLARSIDNRVSQIPILSGGSPRPTNSKFSGGSS